MKDKSALYNFYRRHIYHTELSEWGVTRGDLFRNRLLAALLCLLLTGQLCLQPTLSTDACHFPRVPVQLLIIKCTHLLQLSYTMFLLAHSATPPPSYPPFFCQPGGDVIGERSVKVSLRDVTETSPAGHAPCCLCLYTKYTD